MKKRFDVRRGRVEPTKDHLNTTIEKIGITKKELTEMLNISMITMNNWISGTHPIPFIYQVFLELMAEDYVLVKRRAIIQKKKYDELLKETEILYAAITLGRCWHLVDTD